MTDFDFLTDVFPPSRIDADNQYARGGNDTGYGVVQYRKEKHFRS